jgi:hypothetical protein
MNVSPLSAQRSPEKALSKHVIIVADDLHWMDNNAIKALNYDDDKGNEVTFLRSYQFLQILQLSYYVHCMNEGNPIGDNWSLVTADEFNEFCFNVDPEHLTTVLWASSIVSSMTQGTLLQTSRRALNMLPHSLLLRRMRVRGIIGKDSPMLKHAPKVYCPQ